MVSFTHQRPRGFTLVTCHLDPLVSAESLTEKPAAALTMGHFLAFRDAIHFARRAHAGQKRADGRTFISHPLAVLQILLTASPRLPHAAYVAALLHDTLEEGQVRPEEIRSAFGQDTADAVAALTREARPKNVSASDHEREYLARIARENARLPYLLLIKMADRLHNVATLQYLPHERRRATVQTTMDLYLPFLKNEERHQMEYVDAYCLLLAELNESVQHLTEMSSKPFTLPEKAL